MKPRQRRVLGLSTASILAGVAAARFVRGEVADGHRLAAAAAAVLLVPTLLRNCGLWGPVETTFATQSREVWLTIDDGPDPEETPGVLEALQEFGARASFFFIGRRVAASPSLARLVVEAGHDVQNHTFSHPAFTYWAALPGRAVAEIRRGSKVIREATGREPSLFRAPVGMANPFVHRAAEQEKLRIIGWSAAGGDGVAHDPDKALRRILPAAHAGRIVLLHENKLPGMPRGQRAKTLRRLLAELDRRGLRAVVPPSAEDRLYLRGEDC